MSIGTDIIKDALQKIGVHSVASPANPDAIETGRKALNSMCETWLSKDIRFLFTPLEVPGDDLNEPADVRNGIVSNLAIILAPEFDNGKNIVSPNLAGQARTQFEQVRKTYGLVEVPRKGISSTTPIGQGNNRSGLQSPFVGRNARIDG